MSQTSRRKTRPQTVSMRDIAREAGVSVAAVSYAVNDREGLVSDETRQRILAIAGRLDYQPNQLMRAVRTQRTEVIGVLVPRFQTTFFPEIIDAVERALGERGYHAVMCQTHSDNRETREELAILRQRRVDGLIATPKFDQADLYRPIVKAGLPIVLIDAALPELSIPSVQSDDLVGACAATRLLIEKGHRRIATMHQPDELLFGGMRARFDGYRRALDEAGIPFDDTLVHIVEPGPGIENGHEIGRLLLDGGDATAVFCPSDLAALGIMRAARELGRSIPDDLAIVGYCNQDAGRFTVPSLSTVDQKPSEIGRVAVERLMAIMDDTEDPYPLHHMITPELLVRESSG